MTWLIIGVVIILAVVVVTMVRKDDSFKVASSELGLTLTRTVPELLPRLDGMLDGVPVKIDVVAGREPHLRYRVFYPALGMALRLERETTISRTLGQLGSGDREIGAKAFDDSFRVNTSRPDALQTMMTPELRRRLISLIERHPRAVIGDGDITVTDDNLEPPPDVIVATARDMVAAAQALVAARPPALETPNVHPETTQTARQAPSHPVQNPDQPPEQPPTTAGPETVTDPPEPERQPEPEPETAPTPDPEPPAPQPDAQSPGLPEDFFDNVFGTNRLSFEDDDRFDQEYRGRQVTLSGTVKQATTYAGDDELTPETGTKAVVTVAQIDSDLYGKSDIDAVVFLVDMPTGDLGRGDPLTFTGKIEKVDPFMRNLFVIEATAS